MNKCKLVTQRQVLWFLCKVWSPIYLPLSTMVTQQQPLVGLWGEHCKNDSSVPLAPEIQYSFLISHFWQILSQHWGLLISQTLRMQASSYFLTLDLSLCVFIQHDFSSAPKSWAHPSLNLQHNYPPGLDLDSSMPARHLLLASGSTISSISTCCTPRTSMILPLIHTDLWDLVVWCQTTVIKHVSWKSES